MRLSILLLWAAPAICGDFSARLELAMNRILQGDSPRYDEKFVIADVIPLDGRRFTNFSGDLSGRYIEALSIAAEAGTKSVSLDGAVASVLSFQKADGHFGASINAREVDDDTMALLWGQGRLLAGLVESYKLTRNAATLDAARRLGGFLADQAARLEAPPVRAKYNEEKFAVGYICWTSNLEGVVNLYVVTKEERFLTLAKQIAADVEFRPSQHSHGYLTSLRGMLALYRATGEKKYLEQTINLWRRVVDSGNVLWQGGVPEMFAPKMERDEGCSEADWLRLSLELWQVLYWPEFLAQAERELFNEFAFNQFHTGDFGHHVLTATGTTTPAARAWWCCTLHGARALYAIRRMVFHKQALGLAYDLPADGTGESAGFSVRADSSLEKDSSITLTVAQSETSPRTLSIRVPEWTSDLSIFEDGRKLAPVEHAGYVSITGVWKAGDTLRLQYSLRTRAVTDPKHPGMISIFHGPWLLGVDESSSPGFFDEPFTSNTVKLAPGEVKLDRVAPPATAAPFSIPVAHFRLAYSPGGYPMQPAQAILRPIAEATSSPDQDQWAFWLPTAK
ncbi:MAG TPA: beta-L-arabinofuranosidase domain-containing protein [Bryobacteraceae bacterium]|nr:beta-L-arabinofuranosidase domain-containing protein [Bryobacteraceae bacterium]